MRSDDDHVDVHMKFSWTLIGNLTLDTSTGTYVYPPIDDPRGLYRLRSGRRDDPTIDFDCWYVGRSLTNVLGRLREHMTEEYDPANRKLKKFASNLRYPEGWVQVDRAIDLRLNGTEQPFLRLVPPADKIDNPDEWEVSELIWGLFEAAGHVNELRTGGRASKK